jgi:hypothetical protein
MFICVLDYRNLDNPLFLKSFAETLKKINPEKCIIAHSDSPYTDRIMQTGVMRETAMLRSVQDLNHRLVTFFADYGLPCIGINGFQRSTITVVDSEKITVNKEFIRGLPNRTYLVLSALAQSTTHQCIQALSLPFFVQELSDQLEISSIYLFSTDEKSHFIVESVSDLKKIPFPDKNHKNNTPHDYPVDLVGLLRPHYICKPMYNKDLNNFDALYCLGFFD